MVSRQVFLLLGRQASDLARVGLQAPISNHQLLSHGHLVEVAVAMALVTTLCADRTAECKRWQTEKPRGACVDIAGLNLDQYALVDNAVH